jgi:hypothetical protein
LKKGTAILLTSNYFGEQIISDGIGR